MANNEMIQNEVIAEGVAVEDVVETTGSKGGKIFGGLVLVGLATVIAVGLYKKYRKKAAAQDVSDDVESV